MTTNVVECKDCAYSREANVPNAVFCMLNHQTFPIPVYGCTNGRPGRIVPKTNADRIRTMTDEELATTMHDMTLISTEIGLSTEWWIQWLKSPVEVDK